ncbi:MAG: CBS domain-containing protein, partial [Deltaproteobacteria bacterium]|nr:CBS domain-containing protein [Deltaproteobacteria bacterium]
LEAITKDARQIGDHMINRKVREIMTKDPIVVHPEEPIEEVARRMCADQIHRLPVTEVETGELVGIITSLDLARAISTYGLVSVG